MKITVTHYGETYIADSGADDSSIGNVVDKFKGLLVTAGFHPQTVDMYFNTEYQWFEDAELRDKIADPEGSTRDQYPQHQPDENYTFEPLTLSENDPTNDN